MNVYMNGYKKRSWNRSLLRGGTDVERTYITDDLRETLNHFALTRSNQKIREESDRIYKALKADIQDVMDGKDDIRIMRVVDRKIGKTYALIRLACEYNLHIVPRKNLERMYRNIAQEEFGKTINVLPICKSGYAKEKTMRGYTKGKSHIVLKDEGVSVQDILDYFYPFEVRICLLYTSDAADEEDSVDLGGRRIIKKKKNKNKKNNKKN